MRQRKWGMIPLTAIFVCCCLCIVSIGQASPESDKIKRAEQALKIKQTNPSAPQRATDGARSSQASGDELSALKQSSHKETATLSRALPPKAPFDGVTPHPDPDIIRQGGDNIATALAIGAIPYTDFGTTAGFTDDYDEICPYDAPGSPDVVYSFVPGASTLLDISLCNSGYDTKLYVYENAAGNLVACNDDACPGFRSELIAVPVTAGNTYYIVVDGYGGEAGSYEISVAENAPPCVISCPTNHVDEGEACGDTINDGCNVTVPAYGDVKCGDTICGTAWADGDFRDTDWYLKVLGGDTSVTWAGTANFDFVLIIADVSAGCGGVTVIESIAGEACDTLSLTKTLAAGSYIFFIAPSVFSGYPCAGGPWEYTAWLDCAEPPAGPANNSCANATPIGDVTDLPFSNVDATTDGPDACTFFGYSQIDADIWYCYTASCNGVVTASLCGSGYDTKMAVYDGCGCPVTGAPIACNDDACGVQSEVIFPVTAGQTYLIRIGGYEGDQGTGLLNVSCGTAATDDNCGDVAIQSLPATFSGDNTGATNDCAALAPDAETWGAFTITECTDVTISYCGTSPAHETVYIVLTDGCPCGNIISSSNFDFTTCLDGNGTIRFEQLQPGTYYYPILSIPGSQGPYTISVTGTPCPPGYCEATSSICDEYISQVQIGTINNASGCTNYADFTALSTDVDLGMSYPITVTNGFPYSLDQCGIWVDWNNDEDFFDADETITVTGTPGVGPYTANITVPATAVGGPTRLRTRITYTGAVSPCGTTTYGEVEDYSLNVIVAPPGPDLFVKPDTVFSFFGQSIDPFYICLYMGNEFAPGYDAEDINTASILINGVAPSSVTILPAYVGFVGPVAEIKILADPFIFPYYQNFVGLSQQTCTVTGSMGDMTPFSTVSAPFWYGGHPFGDVNRSGKLTVSDVTYLVAFLFSAGTPPPTMLLADVNGNNSVSVSDLTFLVRFLFNDGPPPPPHN